MPKGGWVMYYIGTGLPWPDVIQGLAMQCDIHPYYSNQNKNRSRKSLNLDTVGMSSTTNVLITGAGRGQLNITKHGASCKPRDGQNDLRVQQGSDRYPQALGRGFSSTT
jgi:hypothetical protein